MPRARIEFVLVELLAGGSDFELTCPGSGPCQGPSGNPGDLTIERIEIDLQDDSLPDIYQPPSGGLFSTDRPVSGVEPVDFKASDLGGGVYEAAILVDGVEKLRQVVADNGGDCAKPFVKRAPCPGDVAGSLAFDTTQLSDGPHKVILEVYDATEVNRTAYGAVDVVVQNSPSPAPPASGGGGATSPPPSGEGSASSSGSSSPSPSPAPAAAAAPVEPPTVGASSLGTIIPGSHRGTTTSYGRSTVLRGRLVDASGRSIAGAALTVFAALRTPGAVPRAIATVTTGADGSFAYHVPPGPSRDITISRPGASPWTARVDVRAPVRLRRSHRRLHNGSTLTLTARVRGGAVERRSADIAFQVRIGHRWKTFARVPLDRRGSARARHTFRVTFQTIRYRFRAVTLRRASFPYANGHSKSVSVLVRP